MRDLEDTLVAILLQYLAEGRELHEAVRWGNAARAMAAMQLGAQTSLPTRKGIGTTAVRLR